MGWATQGPLDRPQAGDTLADTGAIIAGTLQFSIVVATNRACHLEIAQRNALNTADSNTQTAHVDQGTQSVPGRLTLALNERIVVRALEDVDGIIQVSIIW